MWRDQLGKPWNKWDGNVEVDDKIWYDNIEYIYLNQRDAQNLFHNKFYFMPLHEIKLIVKQILCIKLVKYWDKYTEMHSPQNIKILSMFSW